MPLEERPSKNKKEDPSKETEEPEGSKEEGAQRNSGTNGHGKGKTISQDFKERWDKAEGDERPDEKKAQPEQPKPVGLSLFKQKMSERKGQAAKGGFLTPALADAVKKAEAKGRTAAGDEGKGPRPAEPSQGPKPTLKTLDKALDKEAARLDQQGDVLDHIIMDLKGHREGFIQRRKEELRKEAERPKADLEPHISKLKVIKGEMEKKRREEPRPDIFGVGFTGREKEARFLGTKHEERMKSALKASMDKTVRKGSIIKRLDEVFLQPMSAIVEETEESKQRLLHEIGLLDTRGFEGRVKKLMSKVRKGKIFQAESDLLNLKIAMEAQRSREQLKRDREERLEAHLGGIEETGKDLEEVVSRHVSALEVEMDQAKARVNRDIRKLDTKGFEHVVRRINDMLEDGRSFDAEEQLLELKLALKARVLREELRAAREERIITKAKAAMPAPPAKAKVAEAKDLLEEIEEADRASEEAIGEVQCGVCGTVLQEGATSCPACGTSFLTAGTGPEQAPSKVPELEPLEAEEGEGPHEPERLPKPGPPSPPEPPKPPEEPELSEIQCGICGSIVPTGAKRCRACGTLLTAPELAESEEGPEPELGEPESFPALVPIEEREAYPQLVPLEEEEAMPQLVPIEEGEPSPQLAPIEEGERYPVLAPADEEEQFPEVVPDKGIRCPKCSVISSFDSETCDKCGASLGLPLLEPVEEELPELVPVGPGEEVTEELSTVEDLEPIEEEVVEVQEVEAEAIEDLVAEPAEGAEAVPWTEAPGESEKELEWRRLCVRAKRFFNEGRVKAALEAYDDAIEIKPSFDAYYGKGEALLSLGWTNSALDCLNQALEIDEERLPGWVLKAKALEALGRYSEAVESVDRALAVDETSAEAWHLKGTLLMQMGRVEDAIKALDRYVGAKPSPEALREAVEISKRALARAETGKATVGEELAAVEAEEIASLRTGTETAAGREKRYRALAKQRGLTNGFALVNGRGLTNGRSLINGRLALINGRSKVNGMRGMTNGKGKGLINGRGLVNGASGLVNGRAMRDAHEAAPVIRFRRTGRVRALQVAGGLAIVALLILIPFIGPILFPSPTGITIDGQFQDWGAATVFDDSPNDQLTNPDINMVRFGIYIDANSISAFVKVASGQRMLNGANMGVDVVHVFLDTDGSEWTGYSIDGIGADYMLEAFGWDGKVSSSSLYTFNASGGRQQDDWNGWAQGPAISAISKGDGLEMTAARGDMGAIDPSKVLALVHTSDMTGHQDMADYIISKAKGALDVAYDYLNPVQVLPGTQASPFLRFNMTAAKATIEVQSIGLQRVGHSVDRQSLGNVRLWADRDGNGVIEPASDTLLASAAFGGSGVGPDAVVLQPASPLEIQPGTTSSLFVTMDILDTAAQQQTVGLDLSRTDIKVDGGAVTLDKVRPRLSYIGSPTTHIVIDGQFEDWAQVASLSDRAGDTGPELIPRIDIRDYRSHFDTQAVSFYISTSGDIMSGMVVPDQEKARPPINPINNTNVTPGPPAPPPPRLSGADVLSIYLDTDQDPSSGLGFLGVAFGADYLLQMEGKAGIVLSTKLFIYTKQAAKPWAEVKAPLASANEMYRLEAQVPRSALGLDEYQRADAFFVMSDWKDNTDESDSVLYGNRGALQVAAVDTIPDVVVYGTADVALCGLELKASEDIVLRGLTFTRFGNSTDIDTGAIHVYLDNGDHIFNALDTITSLASGQFVHGVANMIFSPPLVVQGSITRLLFVAADFTTLGDHHTLGITLDRTDVRSSAGSVIGAFPLSTYETTISSTGIRSNNLNINFLDGVIDANWGRIGPNSEGYVNDHWNIETRWIPAGRDIRDVEICDNGLWLNFHVRMEGNLATNVHIYIDTNLDGTADYDLIYDRANLVVKLYAWNGSAWNQVNLVVKDRYDRVGANLEMGIEFANLSLGQNQTIRYQVRTEADTIPGGAYIDVAPGRLQNPGWSGNYVTLPEFKDIIIPIIGTIAAFVIIRRRRAGSRADRKGQKKRRMGT